MILYQLLDAVATASSFGHGAVLQAAPVAELAEIQGEDLAEGLQGFIAPIAAVLIGIVALKFLFGENKSLAGFIGFLVLALVVFALIQFGQPILQALADTVRSWFD